MAIKLGKLKQKIVKINYMEVHFEKRNKNQGGIISALKNHMQWNEMFSGKFHYMENDLLMAFLDSCH